ncbi:hypothetical protein BDP27DRAFT_1322276 [Rhodocollybia butyracea]|uniref:Uncharacterized protein n=1 Tax=Rhodocollybia butyracea TaxID=206335 RepID=A0A9P5PZE2_9AGAR|nr:hypothetical protein BDP27DRAFT_1322276 [Rhodocollybia butyracea]
MVKMHVENRSSKTVDVFVSNYNSGGSDEWFTLNAGQSDDWSRNTEGWELVAFRLGPKQTPTSNETRAGVYAKLGSTVAFYDLTNVQIIA